MSFVERILARIYFRSSITSWRLRIRATYGAEEEVRRRTRRPMTASELDRVLRRFPGDFWSDSRKANPKSGSEWALTRVVSTLTATHVGTYAQAVLSVRPGEPLLNAPDSRTVLVADDNDGVRELVVTILGRRGWTTLEAADGHEAVLLIDRHYQKIDLLVTDIEMPRVSGLDVAVRARARRPGLPVVVMSVTNPRQLPPGSIADDVLFLQKPFTMQGLMDAIDAALSAAPDASMAQTDVPEG
jgi:CheY-like chemotaxis protein